MTRPVYGVFVVLVSCRDSCAEPLAPVAQCSEKAVPVMFLGWKKKEQLNVLLSSCFFPPLSFA